MSKKKRRNHTKEFKEEAIKLITGQGYRISETARNLGINPNLLGRQKREFEMSEGDYSDPGGMVNTQAELKRLRKEIKRLKMECEILKKAATFFAKESG